MPYHLTPTKLINATVTQLVNATKKLVLFLLAMATIYVTAYAVSPTLTHDYQGISGQLLESVAETINTNQLELGRLSPEKIQEFHQTIPAQITNALQTAGYFTSKIQTKLDHQDHTWFAQHTIDLGPPIRISNIDLQIHGLGKNDPNITNIYTNFPLKSGQILQTKQYNNAKQFLFDTANSNGYITANLTAKSISVDIKKCTAKIILHFDTGPIYTFGTITFSSSPFSTKFLNRFLNIHPGEIYSTPKLQELQTNLLNSNLFQQANIDPHIPKQNDHTNTTNTIPIDISLLPRKARQYNLGAGYGTDTGVRGLFGFELRHFADSGQSFKSMIRASEKQNNIETHYLIPGPHPTTDQYDISAIAQHQNLDCGKSNTVQLSSGYITSISDWRQTVKLSFQHENYQLANQSKEMSTLIIPSISWSHVKQDDAVRPKQGHNINVSVQGSSKYLLTTTDFVQTQVDIKYLGTLTNYQHFVVRSSIGYTAIGDLKELPLSLKYFTGGTQSVRGYGYNDIGPGHLLNTGSLELRQKIRTDWYAAAFYDIGNAGPKLLTDLKTGVGVGLVWRTAIGAVELTVSKALDAPNKPTKVQFSMGPEL